MEILILKVNEYLLIGRNIVGEIEKDIERERERERDKQRHKERGTTREREKY